MGLNPKTLPAALLGMTAAAVMFAGGIVLIVAGRCIYCDSGMSFYVIESDEDARMVRASMG